MSFPLRGNGLYKPLDSSFRWNDGGGIARYLSDPPPSVIYSLVVIPAKVGMTRLFVSCHSFQVLFHLFHSRP